MPSAVNQHSILNLANTFSCIFFASVVISTPSFCPLAALADSGLVDAGEFGQVNHPSGDSTNSPRADSNSSRGDSNSPRADSNSSRGDSNSPRGNSNGSGGDSKNSSGGTNNDGHGSAVGSFFGGMPLSGQVSVIDRVKPGGMRLKRTTIPIDRTNGPTSNNNGVANSHELPQGGLVENGGAKFQSLFPSLDNSSAPGALTGNAQKDKPAAVAAPQGHSIWQKSVFGGYYDAGGIVKEVVKGNQLYRYGGTMADGMTPAPSGPCEQNSMGYIKWQPIHGGPPGWY
jgi:hypothetical protein